MATLTQTSNHNTIGFLDLPVEIIEHITEKIYSRTFPTLNIMDVAADYVANKFSDFSEGRFNLSALSRTCSRLRYVVERILYRNIQLDFTGWKGRKHTRWPAGSLRLFLRTLKKRPELGRFVRIAFLDFQLSSDDPRPLEFGLEKFLNFTPKLTHLFLSQTPVALWTMPTKHLIGFATTYAPGILLSIIKDLPVLEDLHLLDCHMMALAGDIPHHNLKRLRLDSSHKHASPHFARILNICGSSVHDLSIHFFGGLQFPTPYFDSQIYPTHSGGSAIRTLHLDNISVLEHPSSTYARLLHDLPSLEHLHISHHGVFAPEAFHILPQSLRSLTTTKYYGLWRFASAKRGFIPALASCIAKSTRKILQVKASEGNDIDKHNNLSTLVETYAFIIIYFSFNIQIVRFTIHNRV
ncbi:hypothetical protein DFH06DRAFT_1152837 [Mycena polygramma]|nr:hypothetical protein DFH06DRAFT_1152837 [Mycena polygramma]